MCPESQSYGLRIEEVVVNDWNPHKELERSRVENIDTLLISLITMETLVTIEVPLQSQRSIGKILEVVERGDLMGFIYMLDSFLFLYSVDPLVSKVCS